MENGDGITECILGDMELSGTGCAPNLGNAVKWYQRSAARRYGRGCYELAKCYEKGIVGDGKNAAESAKLWYEKALSLGDSSAEYWKDASNRVEVIKRALKNFSNAKFIE